MIIDRVLNMSHTIQVQGVQVNEYLLRHGPIQNPVKDLGLHFEKIIVVFNHFCKTIHLKSFRGF